MQQQQQRTQRLQSSPSVKKKTSWTLGRLDSVPLHCRQTLGLDFKMKCSGYFHVERRSLEQRFCSLSAQPVMSSLLQQWLHSWDATLVVHFLFALMHCDSISRRFWPMMSLPNFKTFSSSPFFKKTKNKTGFICL